MEKVKYWIKCNKSTCIIISMILVTVVIVGVILSFGNSNESELDTVQTSYMPSETASVEVLGSVETTEPTQTVQPTATIVPTETAMPTATAVATVKPTTAANKTSSKKKVIPTLTPELEKVTVKPNDAEDPSKNTTTSNKDKGSATVITFDQAVNDTATESVPTVAPNGSTNSSSNETSGGGSNSSNTSNNDSDSDSSSDDEPVTEITYNIVNGIDVSSYNGNIDWAKVAASGVEYVMVRIGYRGWGSTGVMVEDSKARANVEGALANGIDVGVYYFSTAVSVEEAEDEALWVCNFIKDYNITYPVAYDCEQYTISNHRNYGLTKAQRTSYALAFMDKVKEYGYTPMFYNSSRALVDEWNISQISSKYKIWKANYNESETYYFGSYFMWQFTSKGKVDGISGYVDLNRAYYEVVQEVKPSEAPVEATKEPEGSEAESSDTEVSSQAVME